MQSKSTSESNKNIPSIFSIKKKAKQKKKKATIIDLDQALVLLGEEVAEHRANSIARLTLSRPML